MSDTSTPRITPLYPDAALTQCVTKSVRHTHIFSLHGGSQQFFHMQKIDIIFYLKYYNTLYLASFIILYNDQQIHNYFTNYPTPTCFAVIA